MQDLDKSTSKQDHLKAEIDQAEQLEKQDKELKHQRMLEEARLEDENEKSSIFDHHTNPSS